MNEPKTPRDSASLQRTRFPRWLRSTAIAAGVPVLLAVGAMVHADVTVTSFNDGDVLSAAAINANFKSLKDTIDSQQASIAALQTSVVALQETVATLQGSIGTVPWETSGANIIHADSYVGIGTAEPKARLHVAKMADGNVVELVVGDYPYDTSDGQVGYWIDAHSSTGDMYFDSKLYSGGRLRYRLGQGTELCATREWMTVDGATGHVGLSTPTPQATLDVNGFVRLKPNSTAPTTCTTSTAGAVALDGGARLCICNSAAWYLANTTTTCW